MTYVDLLPGHVSFSQLGTWNECQQKYVIQRAYHPPEVPAWWFIAGTAYHEATEMYDRMRYDSDHNDGVSASDLTDYYLTLIDEGIAKADKVNPDRTAWMRGGRVSKEFPDKEVEAFYKAKAPEWCQRYHDHVTQSGEQLWPLADGSPAIEVGFLVDLGGVIIKGAIDRLIVAPTGQLGVRDLKTGSGTNGPEQLGLYATATEMLLGIRPSYGDFFYSRKGPSAPVSLDRFSIPFWTTIYTAFDAQRRAGVIVPNVGEHCNRCNVARYCPAFGGDLAITEGMQ